MTEWRKFPAPEHERIFVAGWQNRSGSVRGYWWVHEDVADEHGSPIEHPNALLWTDLPQKPTTPPPGAKL